ncbi:hypothetical protein KDA00_05230 [Candidatus Saccharibacteria bacterium]|nr:hypothetical protein [Candidatus Saccharibacteria bacterium]
MADVKGLENKLDEVFVKNAPFQLPKEAKEWIVKYLPYINLFLGVLTLWAAYGLYHWATVANNWIDTANRIAETYGISGYGSTSRLSLMVWISLAVLVIQAVIYIAAFSGTRDKKKSGWDLLFLAMGINIVYGFITLFTDYGSVGNLIGYLIGSVIGLYLLFQIRSYYLPKKSTETSKKPSKK